jgi:hypothetical protein
MTGAAECPSQAGWLQQKLRFRSLRISGRYLKPHW